MNKSIVAFIALISIVALSLAANTKYSLTFTGGRCDSKVSRVVEEVNYGSCSVVGFPYTKKSCSGTYEITESYSTSDCSGTPTSSINTTLSCNQKCAEAGSPPGFTGTYAKVERYDSCSTKVKTSIEYLATDICQTVTTNNVTSTTKYGCSSSGDLLTYSFEDTDCKNVQTSVAFYTKECGSDIFSNTASVTECSNASTTFAAFGAVVIAVVAFLAL